MSSYAVIFTLLNNNATVTGLTNAQIFPDVAPQLFERPSIIISEISRIPYNTNGQDGASQLDVSRVQITTGATTRILAENIGNAVRNAIDYINHTNVVTGSGTFYVDWISFESSYGFFDQSADQDGLYMLNQDYKISIRR